jgi:hypothetical protein
MDRDARPDINEEVMRPSALRVAPLLAAFLAWLLGGCSMIGMKGAPASPDSGDVVDCTSSWSLPLADMAGAVIAGSASVVLHSQASAETNRGEGRGRGIRIAAWTTSGVAVLFIASGAIGAVRRARCERAQQGALLAQPDWQEESRQAAGSLGAACTRDEECGEALVCDEPMKTCVEPPEPVPDPE